MLNQAVLVGRIVKEPELKETSNGTKVTNITLAVPRSYKNNEGQYELEKVEKINSRESINYKLEVIERTKLKLSTNANIKMILDKMIIEFGKED